MILICCYVNSVCCRRMYRYCRNIEASHLYVIPEWATLSQKEGSNISVILNVYFWKKNFIKLELVAFGSNYDNINNLGLQG